MKQEEFKDWLDKLRTVWETKKPKAAIDLCAEKFLWYETPFDEPLETKEQLLKEWDSILDQKDIFVCYEILNLDKNIGIAHWSAKFTRITSREEVNLDGIFKVAFDKNGLCTEFHQWYSSKE